MLGKSIYPNSFSSGGWTGDIGTNDISGYVHGQEYVINAPTAKNLGINSNNGGVFMAMQKELSSMRMLMTKLTADNAKMLQTDRAILSVTLGE